ncbi:24142_t:CDS:2, partial [Racocetra persica]
SPYTNNQNSSWSLSKIELPKVLKSYDHGYGNFWIDQTVPSINATVDPLTTALSITFYNPVALSYDSSNSYITIYKTSDYGIRQKVSPTTYKFCKISQDGKTISIKIISSTFNQYGEYYVQMDNDFVKSKYYGEPLTGIAGGIWNLNSTYKSNSSDMSAVTGSVSLTSDRVEYFLSYPNRSEYFKNLLDEISVKLPVRRDRLSTNEKYQYISYGTSNVQIIFSIRVNSRNSSTESTAQDVVSGLKTMIAYKEVTTFSNNLTNDLDDHYGFIVQRNLWEEYVKYIGALILILGVIVILYIKTEQNEQSKDGEQIRNKTKSNGKKNILKIIIDFLSWVHAKLKDLFLIWVKKNDSAKAREIAHIISAVGFGLKKLFKRLREELPIYSSNKSNAGNDQIIKIIDNFDATTLNKHVTKLIDTFDAILNEHITKIIDISEKTFINIFLEISELVKDERIQDDFSKINIKNIINERIVDILTKICNKKQLKSSGVSKKQIFAVVQEEIEIILLNELLYICFQKKIKEEIHNLSDYIPHKILNQISNKIFNSFKTKICDNVKELSEKFSEENQFNITQSEMITESFDEMFDTIQIINTIQTIAQYISDSIQKKSHLIISKISTKLKNMLSKNTNQNLLNDLEKNALYMTLTNGNVNGDTNEDINKNTNKGANNNANEDINKNVNEDANDDINEEANEDANENTNNANKDINNNTNKDANENVNKNINKNINHDVNKAGKSIFFIFTLADSESLIILDDLTERFIKDDKKRKLALIRAFVDIVIKTIPLIVLLAYYASSIVIYGFIPLMALTTSCLK